MRARRFLFFRALIVLAFIVLAGQLWRLQIVEGQRYRGLVEQNTIRLIPSKAQRGVIYDRNLQLVASNKPSWTISIVPSDLPQNDGEVEAIYSALAQYLQTPYVVAVKAKQLPKGGEASIFQRLASSVGMSEQDIVNLVAKDSGTSELVLIKKDLDNASYERVRSQLREVASVVAMNEIQYMVQTEAQDPFSPLVVKTGVPRDTALMIEANHLKLPGVMVGQEPVREYKQGALMSQILGYGGRISREEYEASLPALDSEAPKIYAPDDEVGKTGIEAAFETDLRGKKGGRTVRVDSTGRIVGTLATVDPGPGSNVVLTIDLDLQREVTAALQEGLDKAGVKSGVAIALNPKTGEIYSMVSLPSYDDNLFSGGISMKDWNQLNNDESLPMLNRAIAGTYPPGSTFKMVTSAAALEDGAIDRNTKFNCQGRIDIPNPWNDAQRTYFYCWLRTGHGSVNVVEALAQSCDVFFYNAGAKGGADQNGNELFYYEPYGGQRVSFRGVGIDKINEYAKDFGLGKKTGIELPGEQRGVIPDPAWKEELWPDQPWALGDTLNTAIGQGYDLLTPLQLANVTAAVANGGTLYRPRLVDRIVDAQGNVVKQFEPEILGTVPVSKENLATVREGMHAAVTRGSAYRANIPGLDVAGKTGTAEFGEKDPATGLYKTSHAWFVSFAPADDPQLAVVVLVEGGPYQLEGSGAAVPVAARIMKYYFKK